MTGRRGLYFEEFETGQVFTSLGRTITESDVVAFAGLTGDWNPIHTDREYAARHPFGQRVAHGMLGLSVATALCVRLGILDETLLAFREITQWKFSLPIYLGDTIHTRVTVTNTRPVSRLNGGMVTLDVEVINQRSETVQHGGWTVLVKSQVA
jgi:3-hydroxybutyryl-CoA dehydratase